MTIDTRTPLVTPAGHVLAPAAPIGPYPVWQSPAYRVVWHRRAKQPYLVLLRLGDRYHRSYMEAAPLLAAIDADAGDPGDVFGALELPEVAHGRLP